MKLNAQGYRTTGTWGSNPFSKDTVQRLLSNRFYLGQLPDGQGGWIDGQHAPLISEELWDQAQRARLRHRKNPQTIPGHARVHVLGGGLLRCGDLRAAGTESSALHVSKSRKDVDERLLCLLWAIPGATLHPICRRRSCARSATHRLL